MKTTMGIIKENKYYILIKKNLIIYALIAYMIVTTLGYIWMLLNRPAQLMDGAANLTTLYSDMDDRTIHIEKRLNDMEDNLCSMQINYNKDECISFVFSRHEDEINMEYWEVR